MNAGEEYRLDRALAEWRLLCAHRYNLSLEECLAQRRRHQAKKWPL